MVDNQLEPFSKYGGTFFGSLLTPDYQCPLGRCYCASRFTGAAFGDGGDGCASCRIDDSDRLATVSIYPVTINVSLCS
jgi:hypothetical protein